MRIPKNELFHSLLKLFGFIGLPLVSKVNDKTQEKFM